MERATKVLQDTRGVWPRRALDSPATPPDPSR